MGGKRAAKNDPRIEAYGTIDELMAHVGYLHDMIEDETLCEGLRRILDRLMNCAALLAAEVEFQKDMPQVGGDEVEWLEKETDRLLDGLPELKYFTLPCGDGRVSYSHVCRTVCRRAERRMVAAASEYPVPEEVMAYVNRLSDYLYALGRRLGFECGAKEVIWEGKK